MKISFYLFILFSIYCIACNKDNPADYSVIDSVTKKGIPNVTVELFERHSNGNLFSGSSTHHETVETDENGMYNFVHKIDRGRTYSINTEADTYWPSRGNRVSQPIKMDPEGYVKVKVIKRDTTEYARISINTILSGGKSFFGTRIDTFFIEKYRGGKSANLVWWINGNTQEERTIGEDIYFPAHDTMDFEIIF